MSFSFESWKPLVQARHCKRAFLSDSIPSSQIEDILAFSGQAPSSKNTQPWTVVGVSGDSLEELRTLLCERFDNNQHDEPDYMYSLTPPPPQWTERAKACGYSLFKLKNIDRHDMEARRRHDRENFRFFGAPLVLFFFVPAGSERGNFLDMGLFLQNVMLGLTSANLGSCPQFSLCQQSDTIRHHLGIEKDMWLVCGLSVGYPDPNALINTFVPERVNVKAYYKLQV
jgi:nitroreductase